MYVYVYTNVFFQSNNGYNDVQYIPTQRANPCIYVNVIFFRDIKFCCLNF